ncbi:MAG TPA: ParA family protein [Candidatus Limnocylindria bacterium]
MTRVAVCGGVELRETCVLLDLEPVDAAPQLVLVDLREPGAARAAAVFAGPIPRIIVGTDEQRACIAALGGPAFVTASAEPAAIGPLVLAALPLAPRDRTRIVAVTAARGGAGRTLCVANLARRLASARSVIGVDGTGTGALGWWLGVEARPWAELEVLADELRQEHLGLVATTVAPRLSLIGGAPLLPSRAVLRATLAAAIEIADVVIVDAPPLADERARECIERADRVLVLSYSDVASLATLAAAEVPETAWLIASQAPLENAFRSLPRDERSIADAVGPRSAVGGGLGRAYDELAELLVIDST